MIRALIVMGMVLVSGSAFAAGAGKHQRPPAAPEVVGIANLNTASLKQLSLLPGIGPHRAKAILAYREQNHFMKVDDVRKVKGVGKGVLKKADGHLAVSGPNTIAKASKK